MKSISFRFDVDTDLCFSVGVPNLISLGNKMGCDFTFYVNVGRAIKYQALFQKNIQARQAAKLGALKKFGIFPVIKFIMRNRLVAEDDRVVEMLLQSAHEIGLHGGRNHAEWHRNADRWNQKKLESEVLWGFNKFEALFGFPPRSFSSPGWNSPDILVPILQQLEFKYYADLHGGQYRQTCFKNGFPNVVTGLTGEPGGVGYLEHLFALGLNRKEAINHFESELERSYDSHNHIIMYDHPGFGGIKGLELLHEIIDVVLAQGIQILRIDDYLNSH